MSALAMPSEEESRLQARKDIGVWLKQRREEAGLSQRELAERLQIGYLTFISQIESGRGRLPFDRYKDWAEALQIDPRDFARTMLSHYEPMLHDVLFGE
jgi:transcriptional regulator with XRE-family HTH domain